MQNPIRLACGAGSQLTGAIRTTALHMASLPHLLFNLAFFARFFRRFSSFSDTCRTRAQVRDINQSAAHATKVQSAGVSCGCVQPALLRTHLLGIEVDEGLALSLSLGGQCRGRLQRRVDDGHLMHLLLLGLQPLHAAPNGNGQPPPPNPARQHREASERSVSTPRGSGLGTPPTHPPHRRSRLHGCRRHADGTHHHLLELLLAGCDAVELMREPPEGLLRGELPPILLRKPRQHTCL
jgi:hypothetical protein